MTPSERSGPPETCSTRAPSRDIMFDVMWSIELEPEVESWIDDLDPRRYAVALPHFERLETVGNFLRLPASRSLGDGLFELRFDLDRVAWRLTYFYATDRRIVVLTVFRKQRQNERAEVQRARWAMTRCIAEKHTAEEGD